MVKATRAGAQYTNDIAFPIHDARLPSGADSVM